MRKQIASVALLAGVGLALSLGSGAQAAGSPAQAENCPGSTSQSGPAAAPQSGAEPKMGAQPGNQQQQGNEQQGNEQPGMLGAPEGGQARIADMTGQLENAFAKQFEQNQVDQAALARLISDVLQAFPQAARSKVKIHIDAVFETGQKLAGQMPPEERTKAVTPPPQEKLGKTHQALLTSWGWGTPYGFGGLGAFGFPGMYSYWGGYPGIGYGYGTGYYGTGLGLGGWYW